MRRIRHLTLAAASLAVAGFLSMVIAADPPAATRPAPKALSDNALKGLKWLAEHQDKSGGWAQGDESSQMGRGMDKIKDTPNVADTCMGALAMLRCGSTPAVGMYASNVRAAVDYVCSQVEKSDEKSLFITDIRGTRVQGKLGTYIDTFLAGLLLAEVKGKMPDDAGNKRVLAALDKTMDKIEKNQRPDGTWANEGWAPALAQATASKALNRAAQEGAKVDEKVRANAEKFARDQFDAKSGKVAAGGSAGVELYARAANLQAMQDSENTNAGLRKEIQQTLASAATSPAQRQQLEKRLDEMQANKTALDDASKALTSRLEDKRFIAGFGSNGGEEFLSYMGIGESLVLKGGEEWTKWDKSMTDNMNRIQNQDGSWTGHHCITGRTFCTAAALMVLTVDRAPVPVADQMKRR